MGEWGGRGDGEGMTVCYKYSVSIVITFGQLGCSTRSVRLSAVYAGQTRTERRGNQTSMTGVLLDVYFHRRVAHPFLTGGSGVFSRGTHGTPDMWCARNVLRRFLRTRKKATYAPQTAAEPLPEYDCGWERQTYGTHRWTTLRSASTEPYGRITDLVQKAQPDVFIVLAYTLENHLYLLHTD